MHETLTWNILVTGGYRTLGDFSSDSMKTGWFKIPGATETQHRGMTPSKAGDNSQIRVGGQVAGRQVKNYLNSLLIDLPAFISCLTNSFNSKMLLIVFPKQHKPWHLLLYEPSLLPLVQEIMYIPPTMDSILSITGFDILPVEVVTRSSPLQCEDSVA